MKKLLLTLFAFGLVTQTHAADLSDNAQSVRNLHHNNFVGQRPYNKIPDLQAKAANQPWEGTGFVTQTPEQAEKALMRHNQHQMHFTGKRPYLAPHNAD